MYILAPHFVLMLLVVSHPGSYTPPCYGIFASSPMKLEAFRSLLARSLMFGCLFYLHVLPPSEDVVLRWYSVICVLSPENCLFVSFLEL